MENTHQEQPQNSVPDRFPALYVGIGASAGGLEALEEFFMNMPVDSGLAFVVIQHLSPDYKSLMVELLSKRTQMPVFRAEDGLEVCPNTVYLIPPKKNLKIFHGKLLLSEQDYSRGINLPIDVFLRSLADDQGDKAVGIILSGTGSDGMRGIRSIKEAGGMVMVQSQSSAKFDGMPRSAISTGLSDFILTPEEMPDQLLDFAKHPYVTKANRSHALLTDEDGLARIFSLLRDRHKVDFTYYKPNTVVRRIERRMTVNKINDLRDYVTFLESRPGEVVTLYRELLIGVTSFFRDSVMYDVLSDKILPELFERKNKQDIRFWVAGCSTGEEAYSLAIVCKECIARTGYKPDVKIFATDVDQDALMQAGNGIYPESITADLSTDLLGKYFLRKDDNYHISRELREMVVFAQQNVIKDPPFTNIDLISCRNLLIYLQPVLQKKVLNLFNFSLNPKGTLILGTSETTGDMSEYFELIHNKFKIYRSKGKRRPINDPSEFSLDFSVRERGVPQKGFDGTRGIRRQEEDRLFDRFLSVVSNIYIPLSIIINEKMELVHVLGDTSGFFKIPSGKVQNDVTKMVCGDLAIPLSTGTQKAFKQKQEIRYTNVRINVGEATKNLCVRFIPLPEKKGQEPLLAVFFEEVKETTGGKPTVTDQSSYDLDKEAAQRIQDLEQD
ncbi:chemotaxis protein CheR, partial [bacterium]|nr:chemotaxis protein CheR [bacterium]